MSVLPYVGASLRDTLIAQGRRGWKDAPPCVDCGGPTAPIGRDLLTGQCWTCRFPRG